MGANNSPLLKSFDALLALITRDLTYDPNCVSSEDFDMEEAEEFAHVFVTSRFFGRFI